MSDTTQRMFSYLPYFYLGEPWVEVTLDALGREFERAEARLDAIRTGMFPQFADDLEFARLLSIWEKMLDLAVAQPGATAARRRQLVGAQMSGRNMSSASGWVQAVTQALGEAVWTYIEGPDDYTVTIYISFAAGSINSVQVQKLVRKLTPAHIELAVSYSEGFIIGEGLVGEDRL